MRNYDVIVVGGGHAGSEAAHAAAVRGLTTILFCMSFDHVGNLPCNPSIGGSAKGIVVKEIDALGGLMGRLADQEALQMKMLNLSKGPGVHALRAQVDKISYPRAVLEALRATPNLQLEEAAVEQLIVEDGIARGVVLESGERIGGRAVILTTGTYLQSDVLRGSERIPAGPDGDRRSNALSASLESCGIHLFRLKTGTPPRLRRQSIDFSCLEPQYGHPGELAFSFETERFLALPDQEICYLTYTTLKTHEIINANLSRSAMYGGYVTGIGPRYCPSIEDKIVRFADKDRHQLFLEPESRSTDSIYLQGFSTSMPIEVQEEMIHSLPGLERAEVLKYAYAIEYDAIEPLQFDHSLALRSIRGLYAGGQIVGTSGYEEAAALGLVAGINAANYLQGFPPLVLGRSEAYIGVMIDDLVTKGTKEPYRLLSSRSEYRLLTRSDNALSRLFALGVEQGMNGAERILRVQEREERLKMARESLNKRHVGKNVEVLDLLSERGAELSDPASRSYADLIKSRFLSYSDLKRLDPLLPELKTDEELSIEIEIQYEGYIAIQLKEAERLKAAESILLPADLDYTKIAGISLEAREKLALIKPKNIGEASRITNVHPADINVLLLYLKTRVF